MSDTLLSTPQKKDDLVKYKPGRSIWLVAVFVAGLVLLDQIVLYAGNALIRTNYSNEQLLPRLAESDASLFIVGGCRGALGVDPKLLANRLNMNVFNAATVVEGLGNVDFATDVILASHKNGSILIIIDSGNWQETLDERGAVLRRLPFWDLLTVPQQDRFESKYQIGQLDSHSGILRYRGRGESLLRSMVRLGLRRPVPANDGFAPRPATQSLASSMSSESEASRIRNAVHSDFEPTAFAETTIEGIVRRAIQGGLKPILVIVPMHRYWATESVREQVVNKTQALADKYRVPLLNYWLPNDTISNSDSLWSDVGHLNQAGAVATTERISADLAPLVQNSR